MDDHPIVRDGLTQIINQEEDLVVAGEAGDADEALKGIEAIKPDLAIIDISLKGISGIQLTKTVLEKYPPLFVLILSMYDESLHIERALQAGAKGYLTKQEATDHVITAIRKILGGDVYMSDSWRDKLARKFIRGGTSVASSPETLSNRELEVLQLIGQGYSTMKIAEVLHLSRKTIESHYANIKNKLDLKNSHELIQYAVKWCLSEK